VTVTVKLPQGKIGETLKHVGIGNNFLNGTPIGLTNGTASN
jgi:hypothetical protein